MRILEILILLTLLPTLVGFFFPTNKRPRWMAFLLSGWFPDYPCAEDITIRQLLNQTSGAFNYFEAPTRLVKMILPGARVDPQELVEAAADGEPYFEPGNGWEYSNTNHVLLALIAERVTGKSSAELFRTRFIEPLGLGNTYLVPQEGSPEKLIIGFDREYIPLPGLVALKPDKTGW